ncbi:hypothetical protein JCM10908_002116 [Rhodotorula pacifica]|uniref:YAK1 family protein kinase n=1 Tax=Rhodotorula pacifica TaxID=1495444 RepID=UPI0031762CFE
MVRPLSALFSSSSLLSSSSSSSSHSAPHPDSVDLNSTDSHNSWVVPVWTSTTSSSEQSPRLGTSPRRVVDDPERALPLPHHHTPHRSLSLSYASRHRAQASTSSAAGRSYRASSLLEAGVPLPATYSDSNPHSSLPSAAAHLPPPPPPSNANLTPGAATHRYSRSLGGPPLASYSAASTTHSVQHPTQAPPQPRAASRDIMDPNRMVYSPAQPQYAYSTPQQQGSPMRRGTSHEGALSSTSARTLPPLSLATHGHGSTTIAGGGGGSPNLVPMAASPSLRAYSPSDYVTGGGGSGIGAPPPPTGAGYSLMHGHPSSSSSAGAAAAAGAASFYPQHIAQSYSPSYASSGGGGAGAEGAGAAAAASPATASPYFSAVGGHPQPPASAPPPQQQHLAPGSTPHPGLQALGGHAYSYSGPGSSTTASPLALSPTPSYGQHTPSHQYHQHRQQQQQHHGHASSPVGMAGGGSGSMRDLSLASSSTSPMLHSQSYLGHGHGHGHGHGQGHGHSSSYSHVQHQPGTTPTTTYMYPPTYGHAQAPSPAASTSSAASRAAGGARPPSSALPRRKKGLQRVGRGGIDEVVTGGTTKGGQPRERRADPNGGWVSPLKALSVSLAQTYHLVNPSFTYETSRNPRRVLTKPSKPAQNDGFDNEESDYILYVNDVLGPEDKDRYLILDVLGQGTFGQVVKCQNMRTHEVVAVKVVKNKPAYFQQSMMEVTILELINNQWDKDDEHHMLRLKDTFIHHSHLCLVFELLSNNLYELIKQNSFRGLSTSLVRVFTAQLLDAMSVLNEAKIIHCDLKPENILLKSLQSPTIKVIDFGSACHEKQTVYTYIQSRFYRSPEVILSLPYSSMIDMWSLGCICVELFLGLPLFPGTSEFNQITRIVEMLGMPPDHMLDAGKQTSHFFDSVPDEYGRRRWRLKSLERYVQEFGGNEQPSKKYFSASTLPEIVKQYPIVRKGLKEAEVDKEMRNRIAFIDFVQGLLHLDPEQRWSPQQARLHPFILGEPLLAPFVPPPRHLVAKGGVPSPSEVAAAKQQQQVQAQAQAQAAAVRQQQMQYAAQQAQVQQAQAQQRAQAYQAQVQAARQAAQQPSVYGAAAGGIAPRAAATVANPPMAHQQYTGRQRSGTDALPLALQKLGHDLGAGLGAGQSITPVLRRDDQWQAWEQQQQYGAASGGQGGSGVSRRISVSTRHPHLNLLQEQAETGAHSWNSPARAKASASLTPYGSAGAAGPSYYSSPLQPSSSQFSVVVDPAAHQQHGLPVPGPSSVWDGVARSQSELFNPAGGIAAPPLAYTTSGSGSGPASAGPAAARYAPFPGQSGDSSGAGAASSFDPFAPSPVEHMAAYGAPYQQAGAFGSAASMHPSHQQQPQQQQQQQQQQGGAGAGGKSRGW